MLLNRMKMVKVSMTKDVADITLAIGQGCIFYLSMETDRVKLQSL